VFKLLDRKVFILCIFNKLQQLYCGGLSELSRIHGMHNLSHGVILRYNRTHSCDGFVRCGSIRGCIGIGVFELSRWIFPSEYRLFELLVLPCRVILCNQWSEYSDGRLRCWQVLCSLCDGVFKLPCRVFSSDDKLFQLSSMHCWVLLCNHWPDFSDGILYSWFLFLDSILRVYELSRGILPNECCLNAMLELWSGYVPHIYGRIFFVQLRQLYNEH